MLPHGVQWVAVALAGWALSPAACVQAQAAEQPQPFVIIEVEPAPEPPPPTRDAPSLPPATRVRHTAGDLPPRDAASDAASEWYGWQTLTVDLSSLALIVLGGASESGEAPILAGLAGYAFGAPVVHAVHRNDWWLPSLGMRVGSLALMGTGIFVALDECLSLGDEATSSSCDERQVVGTVLFFTGLAGAVASIAADAANASSAPVTPETPSLGLWGDPFTGTAGVSVTMVR